MFGTDMKVQKKFTQILQRKALKESEQTEAKGNHITNENEADMNSCVTMLRSSCALSVDTKKDDISDDAVHGQARNNRIPKYIEE